MRYLAFIISFILVVFSVLGQAKSQTKHAPFSITREQDAQEIAYFPLTVDFLNRMQKIRSEINNLPVEKDPAGTGADDTSVDGMIKAVSGRPALMNLLRKYKVSAYDYVVGTLALSAALNAALAQGEEHIFDETLAVSPENLAFGVMYASQIRALLIN